MERDIFVINQKLKENPKSVNESNYYVTSGERT